MQISVAHLRQVKAISGVPEDQLVWLLEHSTLLELPAGEYLFRKGDPVVWMFIVLQGEISMKFERQGNYRYFNTLTAGDISGYLPFSRAVNSPIYAEAVKDCKVLLTPKEDIISLATRHYELTEILVHQMTSRTREFTKTNVQAEKLMALGKLSAGLTHELNNPASAIERSARELKKQLGNVPEKFKRILAVKATAGQIDFIAGLVFEKLRNRLPGNLGLLEYTEKEEELEQWLGSRGIDNPTRLTSALIDFGIGIDELESVYESAGAANFPAIAEWIEDVLNTERLVGEIEESAHRISAIVQAVKGYTHMDQAPELQESDVRKGIGSTLAMLNHKIKQKGITVAQHYANPLPEPQIRVGEMNQVWTNLIDNAIDAIDRDGHISISADKEGEFVKVTIKDNGKGIPEEYLDVIFEPFFTTKGIGEGTGVGLEVVQRIVRQHNGEIKVQSRKGETVFTVCLPIR